MNFKHSVFAALAMIAPTSAAPAAEAAWPKNSASELSIFVTLLKFQVYANYCSARVPRLKPEFESLMEGMNSRLRGISNGLLDSDKFKGMKGKPVPAPIIDAFKDSFDDMKHNFERRDAASVCPTTLQNLGEMDAESLKSGLTETLTAVQTMIRNLEE